MGIGKDRSLDELFVRTVYVLIPLALAEKSSYSNNAKELLLSLFQIGLGWAPTQASPFKRFPILQELVMSHDAGRRSLGLEMCEKWLSDFGGFRVIGAEYQGAKPPVEFWRPTTYNEIFDCWRQGLQFLRAEMKGFEIDDSNEAVKILVNAAHRFVHFEALADEILDILFELAGDKKTDIKPLIEIVIRQQSKFNDSPEKILSRIRMLDKLLTGTSLWERTCRYVLYTNWEEERILRGEIQQQSKLPDIRVRELAKEYMKDFTVFSEYLPKLVKANGYKLRALGEQCGKLAEETFDEPIINHIQAGNPIKNGLFLGGYLSGICSHNVLRYENLIRRLLLNEISRKISIDCISKLTEPIIRDMLSLFDNGQLGPEAFEGFAFTHKTASLSEDLFHQLIFALLRRGDDASLNICLQHTHNYYFGETATGNFPEDLIYKVLITLPSENNRDQMYGYYWDITARGFLKEYPERTMELFNTIMRDIERVSRYGNSIEIAILADDIVKEYPNETWKTVSGLLLSEGNDRYKLIHWLSDTGFEEMPKHGAIRYMPAKKIIEWVNLDKEKRLWLIENVLAKTLDIDEGGQLTQLYIEEYCDDIHLANNLCGHFILEGWSGPDSNYLSKKRDAARHWMSEISSPRIQAWLGKYIAYLSDRIERAIIEEEREF